MLFINSYDSKCFKTVNVPLQSDFSQHDHSEDPAAWMLLLHRV